MRRLLFSGVAEGDLNRSPVLAFSHGEERHDRIHTNPLPAVLHEAPCPVLTVPPRAESAASESVDRFTGRATFQSEPDGATAADLLYTAPTLGNTAAERFFALSTAGARKNLYITNSYFAPDRNLYRPALGRRATWR